LGFLRFSLVFCEIQPRKINQTPKYVVITNRQ